MAGATVLCDFSLKIASYLSLVETSWLSVCCQSIHVSYTKRKCRQACLIFGGGVPHRYRFKYWGMKLDVGNIKAELDVYGGDGGVEFYQDSIYVETDDVGLSGKGVLATTGVQGEILRDVARTFPKHPLYTRDGVGQDMLANVLRAFLITHPDVGYCQGMNFVCGALLQARLCSAEGDLYTVDGGLSSPSLASPTSNTSPVQCNDEVPVTPYYGTEENCEAEADVYWIMAAIMCKGRHMAGATGSELCMRELWMPGVPEMKLKVYQFDRLLARELPKLYAHFKAISLQLEVLVSQWFMTLFSYSTPLAQLLRLWDMVFCDGWKAVFRIALARLQLVEQELLGLEIEGMSRYLRSLHTSLPAGELLQLSIAIKITRSQLASLQQDFAVQLLVEHLDGGGEWLSRYGSYESSTSQNHTQPPSLGVEAIITLMLLDTGLLARLKKELKCMSAETAQDTAIYQTKIEAANSAQTAARTQCRKLAQELRELREEVEELHERASILTHQMTVIHNASSVECDVCGSVSTAPPTSPQPWPPQLMVWDTGSLVRSGKKAVTALQALGYNGLRSGLDRLTPRVTRSSSRSGSYVTAFDMVEAALPPAAGDKGRCETCRQTQTDLRLYRDKLKDLWVILLDRQGKLARRVDRYAEELQKAKDAEELQAHLSSQLLQLLTDQEARIDGHLRTFASRSTGSIAPGSLAAESISLSALSIR